MNNRQGYAVYPLHAIKQAQETLYYSIYGGNKKNSSTLDRINRECGFGKRHIIPHNEEWQRSALRSEHLSNNPQWKHNLVENTTISTYGDGHVQCTDFNTSNQDSRARQDSSSHKNRACTTLETNIQPIIIEEECCALPSSENVNITEPTHDSPNQSDEIEVITVDSESGSDVPNQSSQTAAAKTHVKSNQKETSKTGETTKESKYVGLLCDFCSFKTSQSDVKDVKTMTMKMRIHFIKEKHNSASLVNINVHNTTEGQIERPVSIIHDSYITSDKHIHVAYSNSVVPMCPVSKCSFVCATVRACAQHYEASHEESEEDTYALGKVEFRKIVHVPVADICKFCGFIPGGARNNLKAHFDKNPEHFHMKKVTDSQYALYFCTYCKQMFYHFYSCRDHMIAKHKTRDNSDLAMNVVYIQKQSECLQLLPRVSRPVVQQMKADLKTQKMNHNKIYRMTRRNKRKERAGIREIAQIIKHKKCL